VRHIVVGELRFSPFFLPSFVLDFKPLNSETQLQNCVLDLHSDVDEEQKQK